MENKLFGRVTVNPKETFQKKEIITLHKVLPQRVET